MFGVMAVFSLSQRMSLLASLGFWGASAFFVGALCGGGRDGVT